jgi:hypothetical protein
VPGFTYRIVVEEVWAQAPDNINQQRESMDTINDNNEVAIRLKMFDVEQAVYRFVIGVRDAHEGLSLEEGLVAKREMTLRGKVHCQI